MNANNVLEQLHGWEISGRVEIVSGSGGLPLIQIRTPVSTAEIYLHGAQITAFQKNGEPPLLFLSEKSYFAPDKAIRGGVPICFPWFGSRTGEPAHGFARITEWELISTSATPDGTVTVRLQLPKASLKPEWSGLRAEFIVAIAAELTMELVATNGSPGTALQIEGCLHNYFRVGDLSAVSISGLEGTSFLDNTTGGAGPSILDIDTVIKISKEIDRTYLDTTGPIEIRDENLKRIIRVEKFYSHSTVVWNPWTTKPMADLGPAEYKNMVCVEAGNVKKNKLSLAPGESSTMKVVLSSRGI
jgi:D-hexose-6-phosphate mutarotase